jgi:hypothetical protein
MDGITRRFGDFVAVDQVTLKIPKGHLYGFLGLRGLSRDRWSSGGPAEEMAEWTAAHRNVSLPDYRDRELTVL